MGVGMCLLLCNMCAQVCCISIHVHVSVYMYMCVHVVVYAHVWCIYVC